MVSDESSFSPGGFSSIPVESIVLLSDLMGVTGVLQFQQIVLSSSRTAPQTPQYCMEVLVRLGIYSYLIHLLFGRVSRLVG